MQFDNYEEYRKGMDNLKKRREEHEDTMPFIEFLETKLHELNWLSHQDKTDTGYHDARYTMQRIFSRLHREGDIRNMMLTALPESQHLQITEQVLDKYDFNGSDKRKKEVINEFRKDLINDLGYMISDRKRPSNSTS